MEDHTIHLLLVEDDADDVFLLRSELQQATRQRFEVAQAGSVREATQILSGDRFDAILLDLMLPDSKGLETFIALREAAAKIPIVVLTGLNDEEVATQAVHEGAQDYIMKGNAGVELLVRSIRYAIERQRTSHYCDLLMERERFDTAVSQMTDGIVILDGGWRLVSANHAAHILLNLPERSSKGLPLERILSTFTTSEPIEQLQSSAERLSAFDISRLLTHPPLFLDARISRQLDSAGRAVSVVLTVRDVTEERHEQQVRANFFSVVSHKLRTPTAVLSSCLHLLKHMSTESFPKETFQQKWPRLLKTLDTEVERLGAVVSKLIDFEDFSHLQLEAEVRRTDLRETLELAIAEFQHRTQGREVEVVTQIAPDAPPADVTPEHVRIVLDVVLDNAVKFADKSPVRIVVCLTADKPCEVTISVADNGPGIPHEYFDRVLRGFVQIEDHLTGQAPGLGVGLYLARKVVEAYGGRISLESKLGEGTRITFTLPSSTQTVAGP